jgi:glutathione peroxidase-family protein
MTSSKHLTKASKNFWTPARIAVTFLVLFLIAVSGISSCNSTDETARRIEPASEAPAPPAGTFPAAPAALTLLPESVLGAELRAVSGGPIKLSDYAGKVLVVNLWATWCGPCRVEIPELVRLHKEYRSQGMEVVGLSTEDPDASADSVKNFIRDFKVNYRVGWATAEVAVTLMQGRDAIPQSFVISRDGHVIRRFVGFNPTTTPPQIKQAIEEALNNRKA